MIRIALAQYSLVPNARSNLARALDFLHIAAERGAHLILFPELCLSPFFPKYEARDASSYSMKITDQPIQIFRRFCKKLGVYAVPNIYLESDGKNFDASLMISPDGQISGVSKMVHIAQEERFFEQDYYTPSDSGFIVYDTPFGTIGIVICFDRHFPESIRTCVLRGAQLILIPTANTTDEPREMFEWEMRVAARQNGVWIAMCNRIGKEDDVVFCGDSIIVDPDGNILKKAGEGTELLVADLALSRAASAWQRETYLNLRRPDTYHP